MSKSSLKSDFLAMNVSWYPNELELYSNQASVTMSTIFTTIVILTFLMGVVVQKSVFKLLKRLPQRAINQIIYPYMVKTFILYLSLIKFPEKLFWFSGFVVLFHGTIYLVLHFDTLHLSRENICRRICLLPNDLL